MQIYNHYRKHWAFWEENGVEVIPTVCWSDEKSFEWCFDGEPVGGTVAVSSVGMQNSKTAKAAFLTGYEAMCDRLRSEAILFYGNVPEECKGNIMRVKRHNCTIIDLHDRSVIASVSGSNITAELGSRTLSKAISQHPQVLKNGVVLHSDRGSQYTSKEFTDYCSAYNVTQSMSRAGCPYDNVPMERYFNTLKSELIYQHSYSCEDKLLSDIENYVLLWYNSVRPHSFNNGLTPWQKRLT